MTVIAIFDFNAVFERINTYQQSAILSNKGLYFPLKYSDSFVCMSVLPAIRFQRHTSKQHTAVLSCCDLKPLSP